MPDFSIRPTVTNALKNAAQSQINKVKNAYDDFMGNITFIGEDNVFDILNCVEELETSCEYGYSQQKAIGQKPVLTYTGEGLKQYSLTVKLHHKFCRPDYIIEELKTQAAAHTPFSYFQGEKYIGEYVITSVKEKILNTYQGVTLNGEITVDILESPLDSESEYEQQTKTIAETPEDVKTVSDKVQKTPVQVAKKVAGDVFAKLTEDAVNKAIRKGTSYINGTIGDITGGIL